MEAAHDRTVDEAVTMPATGARQQQPPGPTLDTTAKQPGVDDSEELHPEWLQASDDQDGTIYYYHSVTRAARWDKPTLGNTPRTENHGGPPLDPVADVVTSFAASTAGLRNVSGPAAPPSAAGAAADAAGIATASAATDAAAAPVTHSPETSAPIFPSPAARFSRGRATA